MSDKRIPVLCRCEKYLTTLNRDVVLPYEFVAPSTGLRLIQVRQAQSRFRSPESSVQAVCKTRANSTRELLFIKPLPVRNRICKQSANRQCGFTVPVRISHQSFAI